MINYAITFGTNMNRKIIMHLIINTVLQENILHHIHISLTIGHDHKWNSFIPNWKRFTLNIWLFLNLFTSSSFFFFCCCFFTYYQAQIHTWISQKHDCHQLPTDNNYFWTNVTREHMTFSEFIPFFFPFFELYDLKLPSSETHLDFPETWLSSGFNW